MSTTERKLFSYDREEDADIYEFFNQLPKRQQSKYIRMAIRLLKEQLDDKTSSPTKTVSHPDTTKKHDDQASSPNTSDGDDFKDISSDILDLGK